MARATNRAGARPARRSTTRCTSAGCHPAPPALRPADHQPSRAPPADWLGVLDRLGAELHRVPVAGQRGRALALAGEGERADEAVAAGGAREAGGLEGGVRRAGQPEEEPGDREAGAQDADPGAAPAEERAEHEGGHGRAEQPADDAPDVVPPHEGEDTAPG